MLWINDTVQAASNTIYVQQAAGGMPEWKKTLISVSVGAFFGILSSLFMEYAKPWISRWQSKKAIKKQLDAEFLGNLTAIDAAYGYLKNAKGKAEVDQRLALNVCSVALCIVDDSTFKDNSEKQKAHMNEIDSHKYLRSFYGMVRTLPPAIEKQQFEKVMIQFELAITNAGGYLVTNKLQYIRNAGVFSMLDEIHKGIRPDVVFEVAPKQT